MRTLRQRLAAEAAAKAKLVVENKQLRKTNEVLTGEVYYCPKTPHRECGDGQQLFRNRVPRTADAQRWRGPNICLNKQEPRYERVHRYGLAATDMNELNKAAAEVTDASSTRRAFGRVIAHLAVAEATASPLVVNPCHYPQRLGPDWHEGL